MIDAKGKADQQQLLSESNPWRLSLTPPAHAVLILIEPSKGKRRPDDKLPEEIVLDRPRIVIGAWVLAYALTIHRWSRICAVCRSRG